MIRQKKQFHRKLHHWYTVHGRHDLPWRNTDDPYHIYLSEVMLQQTQVKTVLERFYTPFLKRFPTLTVLANASQDEVLSAWQGLGYYSRAINLHKTAQQAGKSLPITVEGLLALPGIGQNTAHAIAAFAYHTPVPVMEANVKRVLCRIFALKNPTTAELWEKAHMLLDKQKPFDYNQAMMDIGAMVCTRSKPACTICPANSICIGNSSPESYPARGKKKTTPVRSKHIVVPHDGAGYFHATPRTTKFLHGLYHFDERANAPTRTKPIGHITQSYSHFTLEADIYLQKIPRKKTNEWYSFRELMTLPMSMAEKKILQLISESLCCTYD